MPSIDLSNPFFVMAWLAGLAVYALGGIRFRSWAVDGRIGRPRFPHTVETILLWLIYSLSICLVVVGVLQIMRKL